MSEPLVDLIHVLGKLVDSDRQVLIPGLLSYNCMNSIMVTFFFVRFL